MDKKCIVRISQIATPVGKTAVSGSKMDNILIIEDGAIYIEDKVIKLVGTTAELLEQIDISAVEIIDAAGKCAVPGFVDAHTHFLFGGYRSTEFLARLTGKEYMEIMRAGGGIQSTVNATRMASEQELYDLGKERLFHMLEQGITTVEGKSGYGLDFDCEMKQLKIMKQLDCDQSVSIISTYLGGHAVPKEYQGRSEEYIDYMITKVLPEVKEKKYAEFCDVFCEEGVFSVAESRKLLKAAQEMGFSIKLHADEIVNIGGSSLAAELNATSADHLLQISDYGIEEMANSKCIATLLPCTAFCLKHPYAPARKIIDFGVPVALASDFNPGSCFCNHLPLMLALAVINMNMTLNEALTAVTLNGAAAVNRADTIGSIEEGKNADIVLLSYPSYEFLIYNTASNIVDTVVKEGKIVYETKTL